MCSVKERKFLEQVKEKTNDQIEIVSPYLGTAKPITYICKVCSEEKTIERAGELVRKRERKNPCRNCLMQKIARNRSEKAKLKIVDKLNTFRTINIVKMYKQENSSDKRWVVELNCKDCGHNWESLGTNITRSTNNWKGCPKCWVKNEERVKKHTGYLLKAKVEKEAKVKESFFLYMKTRTDIKMTGMYVNKKTNTEFKCTVCDYKWETSPGHIHNSKSGCPQCNWGMTKAKMTYVEAVKEKHGTDIKVIGEYIDASTKIEHYCCRCNETFKSTPNSVRRGSGCPNCRISRGEERIRRYLESKDVRFVREWRDHNCKYFMTLPMDFYLPDFNTVIEFQGIQHRKFSPPFHKSEMDLQKQQKRDETKRRYCKENGIKLIEIWYDQMELTENIIENEILKNIHMAI